MQHYGVVAHGVTLSQAQFDYAQAKIARLGLQGRATVSLTDYTTLDGRSQERQHRHVRARRHRQLSWLLRQGPPLLSPSGIFLNHGITRRAKRNIKNFGKISAGKRVILKYIFPGAELDHIGHTVQVMESCGFEVQDVEALRRHYARTCRLWHDRLAAQPEAAIALVGAERYRMWLAYLAGVTVGFAHGPLHVFQTVATKQGAAATTLPPTRDDLYRPPPTLTNAPSSTPPESGSQRRGPENVQTAMRDRGRPGITSAVGGRAIPRGG